MNDTSNRLFSGKYPHFFLAQGFVTAPVGNTLHGPRFITILCLLALLAPLVALAQPEQGAELTMSGSVMHFGYQEFDDTGKLLDREDGYIPGLALGLSQTVDRWVFAGDFSYHIGDVIYTGQTNTGIPLSTSTRQNISDIAMHTEYWLNGRNSPGYAFYLGAGYHQWDRDIQPTNTVSGIPVSGLFESYQWWSGFIGIKTEFYQSVSSRWQLDTRLMRTVNPSIYVSNNGAYDSVRLALGERWSARLSLPWRYTIHQYSSLSVEPYVESYQLGRSPTSPLTTNGATVGSVFEPHSQTINYGLSIGINQHF